MRGFTSIISLIFVALVFVHGNDAAEKDGAKPIEEVLEKFRAASSRSKRLVGGIPVTPNEYPWMVSLFYKGEFRCGAVIYDATTILTTLLCASRPYSVSKYFIRAGDHKLYQADEHEQKRFIKKIIWHPGYRYFRGGKNLAILKLNKPLDMNEYVQSIDIPAPWKDDALQNRDMCAITGWGYKSADSEQISWVLNEVDATIAERGVCWDYFNNILGLKAPSSVMCTLNDHDLSGPCKYDQGSPLVCWDANDEPYLLGIVARVAACDDGFSVHTRMSRFKDWIEDEA